MTTNDRQPWLDWVRGLAVLFMIEVHVLDGWLVPTAKHGALFHTLRIIGGWAAPAFLFLAGLSQVLADHGLAKRGAGPAERRKQAVRRALWLLGIAYGFRFVEFVLGAGFLASDGYLHVFKIDVLNIIAASLVLAIPLGVARSRGWHLALTTTIALVIVLATPWVAGLPLQARTIADYLYVPQARGSFCLFNWAAFLLAGSAVGVLVRDRARLATYVVVAGVLWALALALRLMPLGWPVAPAHWRDSPMAYFERLAVVVSWLVAMQLVSARATRWLAWLALLGRHSLAGYLLSIELTYGLATRWFHGSSSMTTVAAGTLAMIALTYGVGVWLERPKAAAPAAVTPVS